MPIITASARCFEETVRSGSIRKASEVLNLSASAVNRHILNLEAEYGIVLLERLPRGVVATEAGHVLLALIEKWRLELDETHRSFEILRGQEKLHVSIGANESVAEHLFPAALAALRTAVPGISCTVTVGGTDELTASLASGRLDAVVAFNLRRSADFWIVNSRDMPIGIVTTPDHPLARKPAVTLADCVDYPIVLADDSLTLKPLLDALFSGSIERLDRVLTTNSIGLIKKAVASGAGISVLSALDVAFEVDNRSLVMRTLSEPGMVQTLSMAVRDSRDMSPSLQRFCNVMTDQMNRQFW